MFVCYSIKKGLIMIHASWIKGNNWYAIIGRYFLAILFVFECIDYLITPWHYVSGMPEWMGDPIFWLMLVSLFWFATAVSFFLDIWARASGLIIAIVIFCIIAVTTWRGIMGHNFETALLPIGFLSSFAGGALMVAARSSYLSGWSINDSFSNIIFGIGRVLLAIFFMIAGFMHFMMEDSDINMLGGMPGAKFWVLFVGVCWFATAFSICFNILSRLSSILASVLILLITFMINIHAFGTGDNFDAALHIAENIGLIGALMLAASHGRCSFYGYWSRDKGL